MDKTSRNSLSLSEEQAMLLETSREFFRKKWTKEDVRKQLDTVLGYDLNVWNEMVDEENYGISHFGLHKKIRMQ